MTRFFAALARRASDLVPTTIRPTWGGAQDNSLQATADMGWGETTESRSELAGGIAGEGWDARTDSVDRRAPASEPQDRIQPRAEGRGSSKKLGQAPQPIQPRERSPVRDHEVWAATSVEEARRSNPKNTIPVAGEQQDRDWGRDVGETFATEVDRMELGDARRRTPRVRGSKAGSENGEMPSVAPPDEAAVTLVRSTTAAQRPVEVTAEPSVGRETRPPDRPERVPVTVRSREARAPGEGGAEFHAGVPVGRETRPSDQSERASVMAGSLGTGAPDEGSGDLRDRHPNVGKSRAGEREGWEGTSTISKSRGSGSPGRGPDSDWDRPNPVDVLKSLGPVPTLNRAADTVALSGRGQSGNSPVLLDAAAEPQAGPILPVGEAHRERRNIETVAAQASAFVGRPHRSEKEASPAGVQQTVKVNIGRVEIREQSPVAVPSLPRSRAPRLTLSDYLDRRFGAMRRE